MKFSIFVLLVLCATAAGQKAPASSPALLSPGETVNGIYRNAEFGLSYQVPIGWVDRTDEMKKDSGSAGKSAVFLAIFEHPPEATTNDINSAVVIAAESLSAYPGLKNPAQYFGPLGEVTAAQGLTVVNDAYEFPVDGKPVVRRDYLKPVGKLTMHQSTLAMLSRGYVLSFTFIGSNDEEIQRLIEWLKIGNPAKAVKNTSKSSQR
jgi:hypothetical protein